MAARTNLPAEIVRDRFIVVPNGWTYVLGAFFLVIVGIAAAAYAYGRATRPGKAGAYALTAGTHLFLWGVVLATFYPVVYLLSVSFNRNDTLAGALPREGNLLVRAGVFPNPVDVSTIQYQKVLEQTNILGYQWGLIALLLFAIVAIVFVRGLARFWRVPEHRVDAWTRYLGFAIFLSAAILVVSITPDQFYGVNAAGERTPASMREGDRPLHPQHPLGLGHHGVVRRPDRDHRRVRVRADEVRGTLRARCCRSCSCRCSRASWRSSPSTG